ncbi:MAG: SPFH domain-containing protein [Sedimentisphaerales bacterium]|jgi:flotillin|nr:SPFH domain-containing protein [Sedimentisphaerales bacterium]HNY78374.1 SPFH domain-containing protein [Sedimentisphaerales bacterium]HOC63538.1 SPFH domain-containing protein [Sedimentisphaerales bacterium]HOH62841.1 SPFH domain-containing protein [Sedimentisphaerales bacterium]HPY49574.1 SPFH domain-containing protein [Sedimentisphaerales bacterium]
MDMMLSQMLAQNTLGLSLWLIALIAFVLLLVSTVLFLASRYKRCPSDRILVIYGKVGQDQSSRCIHGGGAFVWPLIQDYSYMSLTPMTISIPLQGALSLQNIRINVPSTFTVGVSTDKSIMNNAAERLLRLQPREIEDMAKEIIFGQLRLTVASLTIEQINQDRESFLESIRKNVEPELNKIGLYLINVNITDITDESDYIESIGKKAAAEAINKAKVDVAEQAKLGAIGEAQANRERSIRVAEHTAESEKGQKKAEADRRIFVQQQETVATVGEAEANRERSIRVAENLAQAEKGRKKAEADQRIFVQQQESLAVDGENKALAEIAEYNAELATRQAEAFEKGEVAKRKAEVAIQKAQYLAEQERLNAEEVVRQEIERRKVEIAAEAQAEKYRREAKGQADATLAKYEAEAKGIRQVLDSKAAGYQALVKSCNGDARAASTLLMIEKIEDIVARQVEAIKNIKIDKVTVWDSGNNEKGTSSTANFLSGLIRSIPPLHEVAGMAGVELPPYLGDTTEKPDKGRTPSGQQTPPEQGKTPEKSK